MDSLTRVCLISSGLDRFHECNTLLLKKQLSLDQAQIDFYGLFWKPVDEQRITTFVKGFQRSTVWTASQRHFDDIPNCHKAPETNVKNFLSMAWGRWLLGQKLNDINAWERYDVFVYARPDICLDRSIEDFLVGLNTCDLLVPSNGHHRGGINDQFAIGNRKMCVYLSLFQEIAQYIRGKVLLHPETMLLHHLLVNKVRIGKCKFNNYIFRNNTAFNIG